MNCRSRKLLGTDFPQKLKVHGAWYDYLWDSLDSSSFQAIRAGVKRPAQHIVGHFVGGQVEDSIHRIHGDEVLKRRTSDVVRMEH
jgi:hypothetical protein